MLHLTGKCLGLWLSISIVLIVQSGFQTMSVCEVWACHKPGSGSYADTRLRSSGNIVCGV